MYSEEQRRKAIETFIKYDHCHADAIAELGWPNRHTLHNWWCEYARTGRVPVGRRKRASKHSEEMKREAVRHYFSHGKRLARTCKMLSHPKSKATLAAWIDELAPVARKIKNTRSGRVFVPVEEKVQAVVEPEARSASA